MLKRLTNLFSGLAGSILSDLERKNPEALLEVQKENLRKQVCQYNDALVGHAALCERLISQARRLEAEKRELRGKATANLQAGNREAAGAYALRLQSVDAQAGESRRQAVQAEQTYQDLVRSRDVAINAAKEKIQELKLNLNDLRIKQATAELTEMAAGLIGTPGSAGDTLNRLHEMIEEDRAKAAGRVRVARESLAADDTHRKEAEQKALADQALADFAASEGIALEPLSEDGSFRDASPPKGKCMGLGESQ